MKKIFILCSFLLFSFGTYSQKNKLVSDKKYYEVVDKWVAIQTSDTSYVSGFVYIDEIAGFTFDMNIPFTIDKNGEFISGEKHIEGFVKHRLDNSYRNMAVIPNEKVKELGLEIIPGWLSAYKTNENSVEYMKNIGLHYNSVGGSTYAIPILENAYKKEPHHKGLEFELAFAYNATKQFEKAVPVLEKAIKKNNKDYLLYKELGFALMNLERFDEVEKTYKKGISISEREDMKAEMAANMTSVFLHLNNKTKFFEWIEILKKHTKDNPQMKQYVDLFLSEWNKRNKN